MTSSNTLVALHALGQSFWWDALSRRDLRNGELARMRDENGLRGITSNPSIFHSAVSSGDDYDEAIAALAQEGLEAETIFWRLAVEDIQAACDILRSVYDASHGADGFVSLEVDPRLAHDTDRTLYEARRLWGEVSRPNLMIKIPGTPEGVPAIREALIEGININVTLLFSQQAHIDVMHAYIEAMQARASRTLPLSPVASVASFFVSRVDSLIDARLEKIGGQALALRGKAGVANARAAYANFESIFGEPRWKELEAAGAHVQRPLWASTSTKNPEYVDVMYVQELIGPHTVNTMPTNTLEAWLDHGKPEADTVRRDVRGALADLAALEAAGVSMQQITDELLADGVRKFEDSFEKLIDSVQEKMRRLTS